MVATDYDATSTVVVPQFTAFATVTSTIANINKRQDQPMAPENSVALIISAVSRNALIAASAYSACSCLHLTSSTVEYRTTIQTVCYVQSHVSIEVS